MDTIKLQAIFQRVIVESNMYIETNDTNGFIKAVWLAIAKDVPDEVKENIEMYFKPGFKTNQQMLNIEQFSTVKEMLDKLLLILFNAAVLNSDVGYSNLRLQLEALYRKPKEN